MLPGRAKSCVAGRWATWRAGDRWTYQRVSRQASLSDQSKGELSDQYARISTNFLELMENADAFRPRWLPSPNKHFRHLRHHVCLRATMSVSGEQHEIVNAESRELMPILFVGVIRLVPRTRSSHHIAAGTVANFGSKSGTRIINLLVSFSIPKFAQKPRQMLANFGIGTLAHRATCDGHRPATLMNASNRMSTMQASTREQITDAVRRILADRGITR